MKPDRKDSKSPFKARLGAATSENTDAQPPIFSFEMMVADTGYSVNCCQNDDQAALARQLFALSRLSWRDIKSAHRHGLGTEKMERGSIKAPLPASVTEDVTFLVLRFNGKKAMIGYRDGRTFHILLLDHKFTAYKHG
ncbi:hypothetical protein [Rhizobium acidisoli]|uniref:hypothetical protein n=1 Tax=Rhizobium acidisoli TaxID=1538158 RepID=UPI0006CCBBA8|nr:hypothetical protein [Rhizobium acidisoli]KPH08852.1 hypothetical protein AOG23_10055 [Rhizobium acidisoli]